MTAPKLASHELVNPLFHEPMPDADFDSLTAKVLATPDGKKWVEELMRRNGGPSVAFLVADWKTRIARKREHWRTGKLTPQ